MKFRKIFLVICLVICMFSIASVWAGDANDTATASENSLEIDHATDDVIGIEENTEGISPEGDVLTADEQTFARLNQTINGNTDKDIYLNGNYKYSNGDGSFKDGIVIDRDVTIHGNGCTINGSNQARIFKIASGNVVFYNIAFVNGNTGGWGGAIEGNCKAINCTFKENYALGWGGAIAYGSAINSTFKDNRAKWEGGAIIKGSAINCTFTQNRADESGGAMYQSSAINCTFTKNKVVDRGGAMYQSSAINCTFTKNTAEYGGNAMYSGYMANCIGQNLSDFEETSELVLHWNVDNFTSVYASTLMLPIKLKNQKNDDVGFINYDVVIYKNGDKVKTYHCLSNDDLSFDLAVGNYTAELRVTYPNLEPITKTITLTISKVTPRIEVAAGEATYPNVVVSVKADIGGTYVVKVGDKSQIVVLEANVVKNVTFVGFNPTEKGYLINVTPQDSENYTGCNDTVSVKVNKGVAQLTADAITATYNANKNLVITLKDANGNPVTGASISVDLNGAKSYTTDKKGQVKINAGKLVPKTYKVKITFKGNNNFKATQTTVKVTVKKAKAKITAKTKTVKKTKKYAVTLKSGKKPIKNVKISLKINKKTFKAKTNKKGKATFKLKKLAKGKYNAVVSFKGDKYYKKASKKVKITLK